MIKTILVPMTGSEADELALATATRIARYYGGHLNCLRVRVNAGAMIAMASGASMAPGIAVAETFNTLREQDIRLTKNAHNTFRTFCRTEGIEECSTPGTDSVSATWVEQAGNELDETTAAARFHDLTVVSRKSKRHIGFTSNDLGSLTLASGRPVIIASTARPPHVARKIAIAWKNTAEAARAIGAAMPLISRARHVILLSANEDNEHATECVNCAEKMAESLRWHNIPVEVQYLVPGGRSVPDTILDAACESGADFLVTGAYGHSRLREMVFGGFTQRVLDGAELPVFLFH